MKVDGRNNCQHIAQYQQTCPIPLFFIVQLIKKRAPILLLLSLYSIQKVLLNFFTKTKNFFVPQSYSTMQDGLIMRARYIYSTF